MTDRWNDDMAVMVVATGIQPSEYWALTLGQREALVRAVKRANRTRGR